MKKVIRGSLEHPTLLSSDNERASRFLVSLLKGRNHAEHESQVRLLGAEELELAADRLHRTVKAYEELGSSDMGVVLTPWEQRLRQAAQDEHNKALLHSVTPRQTTHK